MWPYLLVFLITFLCATVDLFKVKNKWIVGAFLMFTLISFAIFRDGLGGFDYEMYTSFYSCIVPIDDYWAGKYVPDYHYAHKTMEWGFTIFCTLVKTVDPTKGPVFMFAIVGIFSMVLLYKSIKLYTPFVFIAFLFYLYKAYFWHDFTLMRQCVSISLFVWAIQYIKSRQMWHYFVFVTFACLFHMSSIVLFPLYFFVHKRFSDVTVIAVVVLAVLLMLTNLMPKLAQLVAGAAGMADRLQVYMGGGKSVNPLNFLEIVVMLTFMMYCRPQLEQKEPYFNIYLNLFVISAFIMLAFSSIDIFTRIKEFFVCAYMIQVSYLIGHIYSFKVRTVVFLTVALYCLLGYVRYLFVFDAGGLLPYKCVLW